MLFENCLFLKCENINTSFFFLYLKGKGRLRPDI